MISEPASYLSDLNACSAPRLLHVWPLESEMDQDNILPGRAALVILLLLCRFSVAFNILYRRDPQKEVCSLDIS